MADERLDGTIFAVDLDGVCSDFYGRMREIAAEWLEQDIAELTPDVSYGLHEWGIETQLQYESLHRFALHQRDLFRTSPMIPGARLYLRKLLDEGIRIRIVTHRLFLEYSHQASVSQTIEWLDKNGIPYSDLCFMKEKAQVGADIYVDDAPHNVEQLREAGIYTICFGNSTNVAVTEPRAATWAEVYELVHRRIRDISEDR